MSMRRSSKSELRMLRTMMWNYGIEERCCFCKKPLLEVAPLLEHKGDGKIHLFQPPPIKTKLTVHHEDGNHHNNEKKNRKPCHQTCHKRYHMKERRKHDSSRSNGLSSQ